MIEPGIREEIMRRLHKTEEQEDVRILMAIESGSRAWGFASPNSDYDVRFIYVRRKDWYLSIDLEDKRDVIEYPIVDEIDLNGWDIRKALRLFWKSNPSFIEWLLSPISYIDDGFFREKALKLLPEIYSVEKGIYHYRSTAKSNYREYLRGEMVPLKKYFYVLRPLFAIKWLEQTGTPAPIEFENLLELVTDNALLETIYELLERKKASKEKSLAPAIPALNRFIETELGRLEVVKPPRSKQEANMEQLNHLFHQVINN